MPRIDAHALVFEGGKNYVVVVEPDERLQVKEVDVQAVEQGVLSVPDFPMTQSAGITRIVGI